MTKSKVKKVIPAVLIIAALVLLFFLFRALRPRIYMALPDGDAKQKAAELMEACPSDEVTESELASELMLFRCVGSSVNEIDSFRVEDGRIIYHKQYDGFENLVAIKVTGIGDVLVDAWEGDLHDQLTYKPNGDVLLNGNKVQTTSS